MMTDRRARRHRGRARPPRSLHGPRARRHPERSEGSPRRSARGVRLDLLGDPRLLLPEVGCELGPEVVGLEDLADLDLGATIERCTLEPLDRLVLRPALPDPVAGDELL